MSRAAGRSRGIQHRPVPRQSGSIATIPHFIRLDFAYATRSVLYIMAAIMATAAVIALIGLRAGLQEESAEAGAGADADAVAQVLA